MNNTGKLIQDLILFYVKEDYNHYLEEEKIQKIPDENVKNIVQQMINMLNPSPEGLAVFV